MMVGMKNPTDDLLSRGGREPARSGQPRKPRATPAMTPHRAAWTCRAGCPPRPCRPTPATPPAHSPPPIAASSAMCPASWSGPWAASLVQLMWIELVNQGRLAAALSDPSSAEAITYDTDRLTDRSLELLGAKCQDGRADAQDPHGRRGDQPAGGTPRRTAAGTRSTGILPVRDGRAGCPFYSGIPPVGVRNWPKTQPVDQLDHAAIRLVFGPAGPCVFLAAAPRPVASVVFRSASAAAAADHNFTFQSVGRILPSLPLVLLS